MMTSFFIQSVYQLRSSLMITQACIVIASLNSVIKFLFLPTYHFQNCLGEHVKEALEGMLEDWNLQACQMICITSDSGSNMVKAAQLAGWSHLTCFGHNLHNAVNNGLACDQKVPRAIAACRNVSITTFIPVCVHCFM